MATTGEKIKRLCKEKKVKQAKLAEAIGMSQPHMSTIFNDKHIPRNTTLKKIADFFGVDVVVLYADGTMEDFVGTDLASIIKRKCREKGMTYRSLAQKSGVDVITIHRIIYGKTKNPRRDTVELIANGLDVAVEELYPKQ